MKKIIFAVLVMVCAAPASAEFFEELEKLGYALDEFNDVAEDFGDLVGSFRSGRLMGEENYSECSGRQKFVQLPNGRVIQSPTQGECYDESRQPGWGSRPWRR